ncbi:MAG: hypothetical protein QOF53_2443 [Nocardioidaceae bacterium]|jgi:hypothetical protein|nr:hypothetical protein [Nocardioidaceae bacterium]
MTTVEDGRQIPVDTPGHDLHAPKRRQTASVNQLVNVLLARSA